MVLFEKRGCNRQVIFEERLENNGQVSTFVKRNDRCDDSTIQPSG